MLKKAMLELIEAFMYQKFIIPQANYVSKWTLLAKLFGTKNPDKLRKKKLFFGRC